MVGARRGLSELLLPRCPWVLALAAFGCTALAGCAPGEGPPPPLTFELRAPKRASHRLPALMVFGGLEHAAETLDLLPLRDDVVVASFDYPYQGSRHFSFPGSLPELPRLRTAIRRTIDGIPELKSRLLTDPRVDPARIGIVGASFGAPIAIEAAARDASIRSLVIVHGFADLKSELEFRLGQILKEQWGEWAHALAWLMARVTVWALDPPEPARSIARLRPDQRVLVFEATSDEFVSPGSAQALRTALSRCPARVEWVTSEGGHVLPGSSARIDWISDQILDWVSRDGE